MSNATVTQESSLLMIFDSLGVFGQMNSSMTRDSISLMIYESLGAVWAVECNSHP
jgi:uncharacterized membrane protein YqgA involved in biofilm formation